MDVRVCLIRQRECGESGYVGNESKGKEKGRERE